MKKFVSGFGLLAFVMTSACNNSAASGTGTNPDSSQVVPRPSSNSDATNSSAADTSYPKKDTMRTKGDSMRSQK